MPWKTIKKIRSHFKRSVKKRIISEGFLAGLLAAITFKTGHDLNKGGFILKLTEFFCTKTNGFNNNLDCTKFISLLSILILIITTLSLWLEIRKVRNRHIFNIKIPGWTIGLIIYFLSFFAIFFLIISLL